MYPTGGNTGYPQQSAPYPTGNYGQMPGLQQPPNLGFNLPNPNVQHQPVPYPNYQQPQAPYPPSYQTGQQPCYPQYGQQQPQMGQQPMGMNFQQSYNPSPATAPYGAPLQHAGMPQYGVQGQQSAGSGYPTSPYGQPYQSNAYGDTNMGMPAQQAPNPASIYPGFGTGQGYTSGQGLTSNIINQPTGPTTTGYASGGQQQQATTMFHYEGTVHPLPNFDATQDAEALKKAMRGFGCDDKAVINILCHRSNAQRQQIRQAFKTMYGKDLIQELVSELKGNFEDLIVALVYTPGEFDARELDHAMRGLGTDEATLIEIMTTRSNAEIQAAKQAYKTLFGTELEQALYGETSGHFRRMLTSLTVGGRDESNHTDRAKAAAQAKQLYEAGEKRWGTEESAFNSTMIMTNPAQLQLVFDEYNKLTGHDIEQAVKGEFSSDILDGMMALVKVAKNRPAYFAERAYLAMKGLGTNDRALIRVVVSRCEKEMVQIKQEYQKLYNTSLEKAITSETSGKYKEGLLTLIHG